METYAQTFSSGLEMSPRSGMTWGSSLSLECSLDAVYEALLAKQHVVGSLLVNFAGATVVVRPVFTSSVEGHEDGVRDLLGLARYAPLHALPVTRGGKQIHLTPLVHFVEAARA